jgi:uncharacterized membrane protein YeaQ/YmgE (transglycosylase-associated protein family)
MGIILWLVIGGVIGWLASIVMRTDGSQGIFLNIVVGIVGAFLGGWLISPMVGAGTINSGDISLAGLLVSFLGAVVLLAIVNLISRRRVRYSSSAARPDGAARGFVADRLWAPGRRWRVHARCLCANFALLCQRSPR